MPKKNRSKIISVGYIDKHMETCKNILAWDYNVIIESEKRGQLFRIFVSGQEN